jgi:hypothetical protein
LLESLLSAVVSIPANENLLRTADDDATNKRPSTTRSQWMVVKLQFLILVYVQGRELRVDDVVEKEENKIRANLLTMEWTA